jgi:PAS domain S-box-containing protein
MVKPLGRILIVDDEESIRSLLHQKLANDGYQCQEASSADQALEKLNSYPAELVLLDIKMPGKSGTEILPELKARFPETAVIMATVMTDTNTAIQCMKQGAHDYLTKPFSLEAVSATVKEALDNQRFMKEKKQSEEALLENEARNRAILNSMPDLVFQLSKDGMFLGYKAAKEEELALPASQFLGKKVHDVLPKELADKVLHHVKQTLETGEIQIFEYHLSVPFPKGETRSYEARLVGISDDEALGIVRNITNIAPHPNDELFDSIQTGNVAYFTKNITANELISTIRQVYGDKQVRNGSSSTRNKVADYVLQQFQALAEMGKPMEAIAVPLTQRETELLYYIAAGNSNKQIAKILQISEQTVKNHISSILRKLNANDRAHAVVMAIRNGWIIAEQKSSASS